MIYHMTIFRNGQYETLFTHLEPAQVVLHDSSGNTHILYVNKLTESEYEAIRYR